MRTYGSVGAIAKALSSARWKLVDRVKCFLGAICDDDDEFVVRAFCIGASWAIVVVGTLPLAVMQHERVVG